MLRYLYQQKRKGSAKMATYKYDIPTLLEGKYYRSLSRHIDGIIQYAEKRENVWYGENFQAYTVTVRPTYKGFPDLPKPDFYATICVQLEDN
jgi:hypothetical protein